MKSKMIYSAVLIGLASVAGAETVTTTTTMSQQVQNTSNGFSGLKSNATYSESMLNNQSVVGHQLNLLQYRQNGQLSDNAIYISGMGEVAPMWQTPSYGSSQTQVALPYFNLAFTSTVGDWVTGYVQLQANDAQTSAVTMPQAYFVVGNLTEMPVYFFGGKSVINFGNFYSPNNLTPTLTRIAFMQYGANIGAGLNYAGFNATASLANGDGTALMNMGATSAQQLNAFALNTSYTGEFGQNNSFYVGAGYTNATGFTNNSGKMVGAFDLNTGLTVAGLNLTAEYLITEQGVSGINTSSGSDANVNGHNAFAFNYFPLLEQVATVASTGGSALMAFSVGADYTLAIQGKDLVPYVSYSQVIHNYYNQVYSLELGTRYNIVDSVWIGAAYNNSQANMDGGAKPTANIFSVDLTAYF